MQSEAQLQSPAADTRHKCYLCSRTYERHDHLSRHLKSHDNERNYKCVDCGKGFNRADLLNRHRAAHAKTSTDETFRKRTPRACESCIKAKTKCDDERPCKRCKTRDLTCQETDGRKTSDQGIPPTNQAETSFSVSTLLPTPAPYTPQLEQVSPQNVLQDAIPYQMNADPIGTGISDSDFAFPDFFEQIMMPDVGGHAGSHEHLSMPLNVADFTQDWTGDALDFDFSFLASTYEDQNQQVQSQAVAQMPHSDSQARSELFRKSPWSWIPERNHGAFKGQDEIDVRENHVESTDQHVSPSVKRSVHCELEQEARDRMIRVVTRVADTRLAISSFPPLRLLEDLVNVCILQDGSAIDSFLHGPTFSCQNTKTELLLAIVSRGSRYVALAPVWKMGLVLQEVARIACAEVFETDNSTTRDLQPLQSYAMWLSVGIWSGVRRKTEIAISFLQPLVTMLFSSNAFTRIRYHDFTPAADDSDEQIAAKWKAWVAQESLKRLVIQTFIHDSQVAFIHLEQNRLISPAQMMLPVPASTALWQAPDAYVWRNIFLTKGISYPHTLPSIMELFANMPTLDTLGDTVDKTLCILASCHALAHEVWQIRQQSQLLCSWQAQGRQDRWLGHLNWKKHCLDDLTTLSDYCELNDDIPAEVLFTVEFLTMSLHVSVEDILLFSGKSGEEEARRVYPRICAWSKDAESRAAVWSAGQVLRLARTFEETRLRDFYAVAVYQSTLTLWVYGMVTSHAARKSGIQTPNTGTPVSTNQNPNLIGQSTKVYLDDTNSRASKSFKLLGLGTPGLKSPGSSTSTSNISYDFCSLRNHKGVMNVAEGILKSNFPGSRNGLPPLVENLANLMNDLGKLSGR